MLKVSFDLEDSDLSGKHKFINRLKNELIKLNYKIVNINEKSDIHLYIKNSSKNAKKNIYRLDGIWINDKQEYMSMNKKIIDKIKKSDGVVYQNMFCKNAVNKILNINHKNYACILNGVSKEEFKKSDFKYEKKYFLAMCKWRPHKRLNDIINGFLESKLNNVDLLIMGDCEKEYNHNNIKYLGWMNKDMVNSILCNDNCISTVHLAWLDWCPNSVVESLVAGKQVIHTDSGGTPLVVKDRGYIIKDSIWDFKVHDLYNPPKLNVSDLSNLYIKSYNNPIINFDISDLMIENIAKRYSDFFIKTLDK
jgi:glycosyltransferase involved in cell wall biosynthesis